MVSSLLGPLVDAACLLPAPPDDMLQASHGGATYIHQIYGDNQRQIYWARYIDWVFTTPLLLLDLLLLAACPIGTALW